MLSSVDALNKILQTPDIDRALEILVEWATTISATPNPSVFILSTQQAAFVGIFGPQKESIRQVNQQLVEERHVLSKRDDMVIGFIEWDTPITGIGNDDRETMSAVLEEIYRRRYAKNFFEHIRQSIDFTNQETYFRDTAKLLSDTLSMERVAIRQINAANNLECRAFFHYPDTFEKGRDFEGENLPAESLLVNGLFQTPLRRLIQGWGMSS